MIKRITTLVFALLTIVGNAMWGQTTVSISDAAGLKSFAERVNEGETTLNAVLTADIDLNGSEESQWIPIGTRLKPYAGTFDGGNFTISGLYIRKEADEIDSYYDFGLFGFVRDGEIKNISVSGEITAAGAVGGICGTTVDAKITNCHSSVNIKITEMYQQPQTSNFIIIAGGICGMNSANISECTFDGTIVVNSTGTIESWALAQFAVGGICGTHSGGVAKSLNNCYNEGTINLEGKVDNWGFCLGGICGMHSGATIESCYNKGEINTEKYTTGTDVVLYVGGIIGSNNTSYKGGEIRYCYNIGDIKTAESKSEYEALGTICGQNNYMYQGAGTIETCYYLTSTLLAIGASGESTGTDVEQKDKTAFQNGEVAYLLREYGFGQNLQDENITSPTLLCFTPDDAVYKLTLDYSEYNDEEQIEKFVNSKYLGLPELTTEEEGKHAGWFDASGKEYTSESEITEDITLTAKVTEQSEEPEEPGDEGEDKDDDDDQGGDIHKPQRPIKYYNIYVDTICPGLNVEVSKDVVQEGHQVSAYLTIQAECDTTGMRFEYKRGLFGYWKDLKELEGVQPGEYIIKNIYTDIYIRALDATLPEEEPTGIEDVEGAKAYAKDGSIYVYTPSREEVMIISMSGAIIKHEEQVGLQSYNVSRGIYIVRIGDKVFKLKN